MNGTRASRNMGSHDRKLRYRTILEDLSTLEDETGSNVERIDKTAYAVREVRALLAEGGVEERAKHPGEGYLDSRVLRATSDLAVRCSEAVSGNVNTYDKHELATHIRENPDFWEVCFPREAPAAAHVFGTFAPQPAAPPPAAPRRVAPRQRDAALQEPENVDRLEKTEEGSQMVTRAHRFISKAYRADGGRPLSYFHVVLDPRSFAATVENIYHVSFLVRDAMVAIDLDPESELPLITPLAPSQQQQRDIADENQFIVSVDMQRWQDLISAFSITEPMMVLKR